MPKPYFLRRPSGIYVRFLVPVSCRHHVGPQYIVRALGHVHGDVARLQTAHLGYALSRVFSVIRNGAMGGKTFEELLASAQRGGSGFEVHIPNGPTIKTNGTPEDNRDGLEAIRLLMEQSAHPAAPVTLPASLVSSPRLAERVDLFLKQFEQKKISATNKLDTTHTMTLFLGVVADKPLTSVGAEDLDVFLDAINHWPPNATKKKAFKNLSPSEIVAKAKQLGGETLAYRTQEKHLDRLRVFFNWAVKRQEMSFNPASDLHVLSRAQEDAPSRRAFTAKELSIIFDKERRAKFCAKTPDHWWLPLLMLYTGARVNELATLRLQDVEAINSVWGCHITQQIKNTQSRRFIPLHPVMLEAGFVDYRNHVAAMFGEDGPLFPGMRKDAGDSVGDWFNRTYLRGPKQCNIQDASVVFQCFRHTLATRLDRLNMSEGRIAAITGHKSKMSVLRQHYIAAQTLHERDADIKEVVFDVPPVPPYHDKQFETFFKKLAYNLKHQAAKKARADRRKS